MPLLQLRVRLQYMCARGEVCCLGERMSEVGVVVGCLYLEPEDELVVEWYALFVRASRY